MHLDKKQIKSFITMLLPGIILLLAILAMGGKSLGWFSQNDRVGVTGQLVMTPGDPIEVWYKLSSDGQWVKVDNSESIPLNNFFGKEEISPGDTATVYVRLYNKSTDQSIMITDFGLRMENESDETPIIVKNVNYYLGTQISAVAGSTPETAHSNNAVEHPIWDATDESGNVDFWEGEITLAPDGETEFVFSLAFVDTEVSQDVYRGFGSEADKGYCRRSIWFGAHSVE